MSTPSPVAAEVNGGWSEPRARLDDLLKEVIDRTDEIAASKDRMRELLDAVLVLGRDIDTSVLLRQVVEASCAVVGARYAALAVLNEDGDGVAQFIHNGVDEDVVRRSARRSAPRGQLGMVIDDEDVIDLGADAHDSVDDGSADDQSSSGSYLAMPIRVRDQLFGNLYLTEKANGLAFTPQDEEALLTLVAAAGAALENARTYENARQQHAWMQAVAELVPRMLASEGAPSGLMAEPARAVVQAELAVVMMGRESTQTTVVTGAAGRQAGDLIGRKITVGVAVEQWAGQLARRIRDVRADEDLHVLAAPGADDAQPAMVIPFRPTGETTGVLVVVAAAGAPPYTTLCVELAQDFVDRVTLALGFASADRDRRQRAVFEDRDRIARDLHDLVIQRLFALGLSLQGIAPQQKDRSIRLRLERHVEDVDATIRDIRTAIYSLQAAERAGGQTRFEIEELLDEHAEILGFRPHLTVNGPIDSAVGGQLRADLLAVLRESLSNVVRHAQAARVEIMIVVGEGSLVLHVDDDGVGIPPTETRRSGLANLVDRAEQHRGRAELTKSPLGGTAVVWTAHLDP